MIVDARVGSVGVSRLAVPHHHIPGARQNLTIENVGGLVDVPREPEILSARQAWQNDEEPAICLAELLVVRIAGAPREEQLEVVFGRELKRSLGLATERLIPRNLLADKGTGVGGTVTKKDVEAATA